MAKRYIHIQVRNRDGTQTKELIPAYKCKTPGLAIHKTCYYSGDIDTPWNISHVETGLNIYHSIKTLALAKAIDKELLECGVDFMQPEADIQAQAKAVKLSGLQLRQRATRKHDDAVWAKKWAAIHAKQDGG